MSEVLARAGATGVASAAPTARPADRALLGCAALGIADFEALAKAATGRVEPHSAYEFSRRLHGLRLVLKWLSGFPGDTWQARWVASGSDQHSRPWPDADEKTRRGLLLKGTETLICLDVLHPDYPWLLSTSFVSLPALYARTNDPAGFEQVSKALRVSGSGRRSCGMQRSPWCGSGSPPASHWRPSALTP